MNRAGPIAGAAQGTDAPLGVAILGAGFAGLCMAVKLVQSGQRDVAIFDKASAIGGTRRDNTYPGAGCDVPSHLYSFSFAQSPDWSRRYASQPEILGYLRQVAARFGVDRLVRHETPITALEWDDDAR
ncbi:MAG: NAD(P)-binding protein, partial [Planctomycetia bacterium]